MSTGAQLKLQRAETHLKELEEIVQSYLQQEHLEVFAETSESGDQVIYRLCIHEQPPAKTATVAGDAFHNLRAALDHLAHALVLDNGGTPHRRTQFPIKETAQAVENSIPHELRGASRKAQRLTERLGPHDGGTKGFWLLHRLDIEDKHKLLLTVAASYDAFALNAAEDMRRAFPDKDLQIPDFEVFIRPADRCVEDGDPILRVPAEEENDRERKFRFTVALDEPGLVDCKRLMNVSRGLYDLVERTLEIYRRFCFS